jgi:hypothetical protein
MALETSALLEEMKVKPRAKISDCQASLDFLLERKGVLMFIMCNAFPN